MEGKLSSQYSSTFEKTGAKTIPYLSLQSLLFIREAYNNERLNELVSFVVRQLFHKCGLFRKKQYLEFKNSDALTLENERLNALDSSENMDHFFRSRELSIVRSYHNWIILFMNNNKEIYGCLYTDDKNLYKSIDNGTSIIIAKRSPEPIKSIFISSQNTTFVCVQGAVYNTSDYGGSFKKSVDLSSSIS